MEYYNGKLCISMRELVDGGIMTIPNYKQLAARKKIDIARRGDRGGCALVVVDSFPPRYKEDIYTRFPDSDSVRLAGWVRSNYEIDQSAVVFFHDREKTGLDLKPEKIREYITNASVLNTCIRLYDNARTYQRIAGDKYDWGKMAAAVDSLRVQFGHTLPGSMLRFRKKVAEYRREGYGCLISGKFGNQSARKVDYRTERLILGIAVLPNKPFNTNVAEMYNQFVCGELDVYDPETGELFNPDDFTDRDGEPRVLSETTINNYLNKPKNRVLIEHKLSSWSTFMHEQMPHMHRHAPEFSFSKISFDDRDLPRKLKDTKARPKAYYAYDVASQCVVGFAYNRNKNVDLVVDMFRSMFRLIDRKGWGCPAQVEVENHLMSQWKDSFLKAGVMFPFVRFCAPQNSQEKYAEPMNGAKKKAVEHRNHLGIGRFYAKDRHYRTEGRKVFDEQNDTYEDKQYYSWDELVADDMRDVMEFNNSLHPNQKKYPGMTRWQVLEANMNPNLEPINKAVLARFIGDHVETSVRRNSYCRVGYTDWWLSGTGVLERLAPNNWKVDAYYLTDDDGNITDVYIYQNGMLVDKLQNVGTFNTADCEQTDADRAVFVEQRKKISGFNAYVRDNAISSVGVSRARPEQEKAVEAVELPSMDTESPVLQESFLPPEDYSRKGFDDLM
nr:MAG TPA: transposase [Caudoviricetes sp.]